MKDVVVLMLGFAAVATGGYLVGVSSSGGTTAAGFATALIGAVAIGLSHRLRVRERDVADRE